MSNIGEQPTPKAWVITLERQDGTMVQRRVPEFGETLSEASRQAELKSGEIWMAVAGMLLR